MQSSEERAESALIQLHYKFRESRNDVGFTLIVL